MMPSSLSLKPKHTDDALVARIDALLPQTQCRQCSYDGCKPYAVAIAMGEAAINQCPPGGEAGIRALAALLQRDYQPLNEQHGRHKPKSLAVIDETLCIGCTLCIQACPVHAIAGAAKQMHTVIASECTGCELCLAPCPVDCIAMLPIRDEPGSTGHLPVLAAGRTAAEQAVADLARERFEFRLHRLEQQEEERRQQHLRKTTRASGNPDSGAAARKAAIAAAMARVSAQKTQAREAGLQPRNIQVADNIRTEIDAIEARRALLAQQERAK